MDVRWWTMVDDWIRGRPDPTHCQRLARERHGVILQERCPLVVSLLLLARYPDGSLPSIRGKGSSKYLRYAFAQLRSQAST